MPYYSLIQKTNVFRKILITFSLILLGSSVGAQQGPPTFVNVVPAQQTKLSPMAWVSGSVVSQNNSQIAPEVSGRLEKLAEIGKRVSKGDVIAIIDDSKLKIALTEAKAAVTNAQSRLNFLNSEVERKTALAKRNLSAKTDLDETISQRDVAQGELIAAKARLAKTQQDLDFSKVTAPFDGLVAQRLKSQGEYVTSGTAIIRLVETKNLEASLFAPLTGYRYLQQVDALEIESPLGKGKAPIKSLVPVSDTRSHLMEVRLDLSEFDWPVGLNIKVAVANGPATEVIAIPRDALVLRREGTSVFKINQDNSAEQVNVIVGVASGDLVAVSGEIKAGDQVVIRGAERLRPGQTVQIKPDNSKLLSGKVN